MTEDNKSYPSFQQQGKNLATFAFDLVKSSFRSGALFVSPEIKKERLDICKTCEWYDSEQVRCKHCGCMLEHKAGFALDSCPIQKWTESTEDWVNQNFDKVMNQIENPQMENPDVPQFPREKEIGDRYLWKNNAWKWDGNMWQLD
jgi:hypothetical protein